MDINLNINVTGRVTVALECGEPLAVRMIATDVVMSQQTQPPRQPEAMKPAVAPEPKPEPKKIAEIPPQQQTAKTDMAKQVRDALDRAFARCVGADWQAPATPQGKTCKQAVYKLLMNMAAELGGPDAKPTQLPPEKALSFMHYCDKVEINAAGTPEIVDLPF
ncbi:MAG: hypothetical protein K2H47_08700 [Muribaculaceae bacterium]|nr:hypothetical protein [Muribaculaceae bacterium]